MQVEEPAPGALDFLPEAMVNEMLGKYDEVTIKIRSQLDDISKVRQIVRDDLSSIGLLVNASELINQKSYPSTVGIDGSNVPIKQLALDTLAVAAVAVEGLIPPKEERMWPKPHHHVRMFALRHHPKTPVLSKALMFSYELELAAMAPHRVVYLDGSLTSQLISFGMAYTTLLNEKDLPGELRDDFSVGIQRTLQNYLEILESKRIGKVYVGVPKYSSRAEIMNLLNSRGRLPAGPLERFDDKGFLTHILRPGEMVGPFKLTGPSDRWHLSGIDKLLPDIQTVKNSILTALNNLHVLYFRPSLSHPALRLEVSGEVANSPSKLSTLLESLEDQSRIPGIIEPYPLFIADNFVSQIYPAVVALKDVTLSNIGAAKDLRFSDIFLSLHEYRSEGQA